MYPSVLSAFRAFNEPFEGWVPYMYLDIKGLVTVGVGNLIDPVDQATILPFRFKDTGALASAEQIAAEWRRIKDDVWLAKKGHTDAGPLTTLELNADAVNALVAERLNRNESYLMRQPPFQQFTAWPADAQMALLSMAWAMGPAGPQKFTRFCAACVNLDFRTAAADGRTAQAGRYRRFCAARRRLGQLPASARRQRQPQFRPEQTAEGARRLELRQEPESGREGQGPAERAAQRPHAAQPRRRYRDMRHNTIFCLLMVPPRQT